MDRYAVMGNPVSHSQSPAIHSAFAEQTKQELSYTAIEVARGEFEAAVRGFFDGGGKGLNVTVPFKEEAWALSAVRSSDADIAGAVNTLFMDESGGLHGHNTDGIGLVRDIRDNHGGVLAGRDILLLGAGGAARGILLPLLREQPARICIANRTAARAEQLADIFRPHGTVEACGLDALGGRSFDWVVNATSASLNDELPQLPEGLLADGAWCYDLMYGPDETAFCRWANRAGADKAVDGFGMLVEQAAESYYLWRGIMPDTKTVIASLRAD